MGLYLLTRSTLLSCMTNIDQIRKEERERFHVVCLFGFFPLHLQPSGKDNITFLTFGIWEVVKILAFKKDTETV